LCPTCKRKLKQILETAELKLEFKGIRYTVFYNEIGIDCGDAGPRASSYYELNAANTFYEIMKDKCNFIQLWDLREQKTLKQIGL
jgi:hypothetical protein